MSRGRINSSFGSKSLQMLLLLLVGLLFPSCLAETFNFNVLQWNIFRRQDFVGADGQEERLQRIPKYIASINNPNAPLDVITFCEAWEDSQILVTALKSIGFPYATTLLKDNNPFSSLTNGGVIVVSAHPIVREDFLIYRDSCHGADCLAAKGVKYARIQKTNPSGNKKEFNVFASHMQAWDTNQTHKDRRLQASQWANFIASNKIPKTEPVILTGDLNTDLGEWIDETRAILQTLGGVQPNIVGNQIFTVNPSLNLLVGRDGGADDCKDAYKRSWGPKVNNVYSPSPATRVPCANNNNSQYSLCYCPCCPFQWLDYVLYGWNYERPIASSIRSLEASADPFSVVWDRLGPIVQARMPLWDLSDHYPVLAQMQFNYTAKPVVQDGCKNDDDCHLFLPAYCYCTGPGCTLNGTVVNGRNYGPYDTVNAMCRYEGWSFSCVCHF